MRTESIVWRSLGVSWAMAALLLGGPACERGTTANKSAPQKAEPAAVPTAGPTNPGKRAAPQEAKMTDSAVDESAKPRVEWRMTKDGDKLRVSYSVENPGAKSIWLVDDLVVWGKTGFVRAPKSAIVRNSDQAGVVSLYRGDMYIPTREMRQYPRPGIREVAAKAKVEVELEIPLPLTAWHYYHPKKMPALQAKPTQAVLELQYLVETSDHGPVRGGSVPLEGGGTITTPRLPALQHSTTLRSAPKPLPAGS